MTGIKNHQIATVIFAIALAGLLLVSTSAVGNAAHGGGHGGGGHGSGSSSGGSSSSGSSGSSDPLNKSNNLLVNGTNTGINVQTDTGQKQDCQTAGANSPLSGSCVANTNNQITGSGGILSK